MHGLQAQLGTIDAVSAFVAEQPIAADVLVCPPATLLAAAVRTAAGRIAIGGQDCHAEAEGAFTGDLSAEMLRDAGAAAVIVGHSERRQRHAETDAMVAAKALAAARAGLMAIICIGETAAQREHGTEMSVCAAQLASSVPPQTDTSGLVIAYEPLWAIGTGRVPTVQQIEEMHQHIRGCLLGRFGEAAKTMRILYGGSVKPENARAILALPEVGGALVGGASLDAVDFEGIVRALMR